MSSNSNGDTKENAQFQSEEINQIGVIELSPSAKTPAQHSPHITDVKKTPLNSESQRKSKLKALKTGQVTAGQLGTVGKALRDAGLQAIQAVPFVNVSGVHIEEPKNQELEEGGVDGKETAYEQANEEGEDEEEEEEEEDESTGMAKLVENLVPIELPEEVKNMVSMFNPENLKEIVRV